MARGSNRPEGSRAGALLVQLAEPFSGDELFDAVPDTVYFLKDRAGRYAAVNLTLVERTGRKTKADLIGLTAEEAFPPPLGAVIGRQDRAILSGSAPLRGELELHLYPDGREGWCLTWKEPLMGARGAIVGLVGLSRDVRAANVPPGEARKLASAMRHAQDHLDAPLRVADLAERAGLSAFQFDQRVRLMFGHSAGHYLTRLRIDHARGLLQRSEKPISEIALDCGYADQTAFTRQFKKTVNLSPLQYRKMREH